MTHDEDMKEWERKHRTMRKRVRGDGPKRPLKCTCKLTRPDHRPNCPFRTPDSESKP